MEYAIPIIIIFAIYYMMNKQTRIKKIAKTQLMSYYAFRSKYPNTPKEYIYKKVIFTRPPYNNEENYKALLAFAESLASQKYGNYAHATLYWITMAICAIELYPSKNNQVSGENLTYISSELSKYINESI